MFIVFSPQDWWDMAAAAEGLRDLPTMSEGPLTNVLISISTLDDPYYMEISPATYKVAAGL